MHWKSSWIHWIGFDEFSNHSSQLSLYGLKVVPDGHTGSTSHVLVKGLKIVPDGHLGQIGPV